MRDTPQKLMPAEETLVTLFLDLFESNELRDILGGLPGGQELKDSLPGVEVSRLQLANAAVEALQKRGLINTDLLSVLFKKRPGQITRIKEVAQILSIEFDELDIPKPVIDDLESVLTQVTRQVVTLSSRTGTLELAMVLEILRFAISLGRPRYNSGDEKSCALIYKYTTQQILAVMPEATNPARHRLSNSLLDIRESASRMGELPLSVGKHKPRGMGDFGHEAKPLVSGLTEESNISVVRNDLAETLNSCPEIDTILAEKVAWRLRHSFNRVFNFVSGILAVDAAANSSSSYETKKNLSMLVKFALGIYDQASDDMERSRAIQTSASLLSYSAKIVEDILSHPVFMEFSSEDREDIMSILIYCRTEVNSENAYRIAWNARYGLEKLLKFN
jgi:hypothetical protein